MAAFTFEIPPDSGLAVPFDETQEYDRLLKKYECSYEAALEEAQEKNRRSSHFSPPASRPITLRMPTELIERLDQVATDESTSRSNVMRQITAFVLDFVRNDRNIGDECTRQLYDKALGIVIDEQAVSVSLLQRQLRIDYGVALLLMDKLERGGVVSPLNGLGFRLLLPPYSLGRSENDQPDDTDRD